MYKIEEITNKILQGNCLSVLKEIPDAVIDMVITSPPYWNQRNYSTNHQTWGGDENCQHSLDEKQICTKCNAFVGELGSEPTPEQFISNLSLIFKEVFRVIKPTGTVWVNLDDSYFSGDKIKHKTIKKKSLCLVPQRFSIAMQEMGFIIRNEIKWWKASAMPEATTDRFTHCYEYIYFMVKSQKYFFEQQFEPMAESSLMRAKYGSYSEKTDQGIHGGMDLDKQKKHFQNILDGKYPGRNHRDIFQINTRSFTSSHFATFPPELLEKPILAGSPQFICTKCGEPRKKIYEVDGEIIMGGYGSKTAEHVGVSETSSLKTKTVKTKSETGMSDCGCKDREFRPGIVLDPFSGAATTFITANKLGRAAIGIELNPDYIKLSQDRISSELGLFNPL